VSAMKNKKKIWIGIAILLFVGLLAVISWKSISIIQDNKRLKNTPPSVAVMTPKAGDTVASGSVIVVSATAQGANTIQYMEVWLDGKQVGKVFNDHSTEGTFFGALDVEIGSGGHSLSVRVVDREGTIGQSQPIAVYGSDAINEDVAFVTLSQDGDTLNKIADDYGVDAGELEAINQDLGQGELPPGTAVKLPDNDRQAEEPDGQGGQDNTPSAAEFLDTLTGNPTILKELANPNPVTNPFKILTQGELPKAPDGLEFTHKDCLATLKWNDNSDYEQSYRIWMVGLGLSPRVIATVESSAHTGPVWFQFNIPPAWMYGFWIEAVNFVGAQPSEELWVGIPETQCVHHTAAYMNFIVDSLEVKGNYDRVYCYASIEGAPEQRLPVNKDEFFGNFQPSQFWGDFVKVDVGGEGFTIPYPDDGSIEISGECMAWSGASLQSLGTYSANLMTNEEGIVDPKLIDEPNFKLVVSVTPAGLHDPVSVYSLSNPLIEGPVNLQIRDTGNRIHPDYPTNKCLSWDWKGDQDEIEGFTIFLDDNPFKLALPHERSVCFTPPSKCGSHFTFAAAANLPNGQTNKTTILEYDQEPCDLWAEVQFVSIGTGYTSTSRSGKCDPLETYFELHAYGATHESRNFGMGRSSAGVLSKGGVSRRFKMKCSSLYTFDDIGYATTKLRDQDRLVVQIDPQNPFLEIDVYGFALGGFSQDKILVMLREEIPNLPVNDWAGYDEIFSYEQFFNAAATLTTVRVRAIDSP